MEKNKITMSLGTFIVIIILITVLIIGAIFLGYTYIKQQKTNQNIQAEKTQDENIFSELEEYTKPANKDKNNSQTNDKDNKKEDTSLPTNNNSGNKTNTPITGKKSSIEAPLEIGEWGIASKRSSGEYVDIPVKVANVTRGNSAAQKVKDYCNSGSSIYRYEDAKDGMEWAIIEYTVDLTNITASASGEKQIKVDSKITGRGSSSIKYNGNVYIVSTMDMTTNNNKENIANGKFAVQLPIGCNEYIIALGSPSNTQAYFMGK